MFCVKCGKELPDDAQFCSGCGTKVGGEKRTVEIPKLDIGALKEKAEKRKTKGLEEGMKILESCKWFFFGGIVALIVAMFFLGAEMFEVNYQLLWSDRTETFTMFNDRNFFKVLFIFGYLLAAGMLLYPLFAGKIWKLDHFYLALGMPVLSILVLIFVMIAAKNKMADDSLMQAVDAAVTLSTSGWLFIIINLLAVGLLVKANLSIAEVEENMPEEEAEKVPEKPYWCAMCGEEGPFEDGCTKCGSHSKVFFKDDVIGKNK